MADTGDDAKLILDAHQGDQSALVKASLQLRTRIEDLDRNLSRLLDAIHTLDFLLVVLTVVLVVLTGVQIWLTIQFQR